VVRRRQPSFFEPIPLIALAAALCGPVASAQVTTPSVQNARDFPQSASSQTSAPVPVIRTYSNIVVIDVVVTDSQGNPVKNLPASAFTLTEDKKPQMLRHFEEHDAPADGTRVAAPPPLPPGLFSNRPPAPENGPMNVLLLDYLNTPLMVQPHMHDQLVEYLNKAPAGTRIAIFGLSNRLYMLQGFTADMGVLKAALSFKKGPSPVSNLLRDPVQGGSMNDTTLSSNLSGDPNLEAASDAVKRFEAVRTSDYERLQAQATLAAFDQLARYLVAIPGRKNVLWFSAGFPLDVQPDVNSPTAGGIAAVSNDDEIRKTDNLLTQAQVAVYPIDSRGVTSFMNPIDGTGTDSLMDMAKDESNHHLAMEAMAEDTGGKAFYNTNDLTKVISSAVSNGSNYYTLTYSPTNKVWDERFRAIKITVDQPRVKLAYREGYYAIDPNNKNRVAIQGAAMALVQPTTMATAMLHGGPEESEILFKVRIRPSDSAPGAVILQSNQSNPDPKVKIEGPFKAYGVDLVPDSKSVSCNQGTDGNRHCALEVWTFVYNGDGEKLITASNRLHTVLTADQYAKLLSGGMAFHQEISVPVKGRYFLRTAIHDLNSDRVGAVEVPVTQVAHLEPLKSVASSAAPAPTEPMRLPASASRDAATAGGAATPASAPAPSNPSETAVPIGPAEPTLPSRSK
jgi:VWFA-related protein